MMALSVPGPGFKPMIPGALFYSIDSS